MTSAAPTEETAGVDSTTQGTECELAAECQGEDVCVEGSCQACTEAALPDAACADASAATPYCDADLGCVACIADVCDGDAPACDPSLGCVACTEHWQCPDSACHLAGPDQGRCFDIADVVEISDVTEFEDEFATLGPGAQRVFRVSGEVPDMGGYIIEQEIAIIGEPGAVMMGGYTNLFTVSGGSFLYVGSIAFREGAYRAFSATGTVWIDDVEISDYTIALNIGGEAHVRRSRLTATGEGSTVIYGSGDFYLENVAVGSGADIGMDLNGDAQMDARYVTVAGNPLAVSCEVDVTGSIRNSVIVGDEPSAVSGCESLAWVDNAVSDDGLGTVVGPYDEGWFTNASQQDFHLSASGAALFDGIADWDDGDPLFDIDGDARPQDVAATPGIDQP